MTTADVVTIDVDEFDGTMIIGGGIGRVWGVCGSSGSISAGVDDPGGVVDTTVVVITGITSSGELCTDVTCTAVRLISSDSKSSIRPMRCAIRCISKRMSTFMSITEEIKSRWASELAVSRTPLS